MIRIDLEDCETAHCYGLVVNSKKGPICKLARKLIDAGYDSAEEVGVFRGERECFLRYPLSKWAALSISEPDNGSSTVRFTKYQPHPLAA